MAHQRLLTIAATAAVFALLLPLTACTRLQATAPLAPAPHLELEMTGAEYARILSEQPSLFATNDAKTLKPIFDLGKRNLDLLNFINQHRDEAHHISLTSKETQNAFPVDQAREYNVTIVLKMYSDLLAVMPAALKTVLLGNGAFPENPPISEEDYKTWGRKADVVYQLGTRWILLKPYLDHYTQNRKKDVRGFYALVRETDLSTELASWKKLDLDKRTALRSWLIGSCYNSAELAQCEKDFDVAVQNPATLQAYANKSIAGSQALWDSFFTMQWDRSDIVWTAAHPEVLRVPFVDPNDAGVMNYLRDNIEDEWKWTGWNLRLDFQAGSDETMTHLRFESGVTPHVEVPNTIVMDKNQPTTEYDSQWTIRHEFGHILGFPDCYVEFYDKDRSTMVSYQLDITNLMCSRRGVFKETHFNELKRVYFH